MTTTDYFVWSSITLYITVYVANIAYWRGRVRSSDEYQAKLGILREESLEREKELREFLADVKGPERRAETPWLNREVFKQ